MRFSIFVTKNKTYLNSEFIQEEKFLNSMYLWDDYYYDHNNLRLIDTDFVKVGSQSIENGAVNMRVTRQIDEKKEV